ncbi:MAG TPA: hypothetical protein VK302_22995 [Terriglobales bacterium]|jgi:hypothetical protein|nr:hypothetical protein [Terriglobales bacterium]
MNKFALLLLCAASLSFAQQSAAPAQLTQVPPKPTCNPLNIFTGRDCQSIINTYNQALQQRQREELQLYVNRQRELASAPLQQQIADLNKLVTDQQEQIKKLGEQMQTEATADQQQAQANAAAALQAKSDARREGLLYGAGAVLVLFGLVFGVRKLTQNFSVTKKPQSHAASA